MVVGRGGAAMGSETLRPWYPDALLGVPIDIAGLHWEERSCPLAKRSDALGCLQPTYGQLSSLRAPQPPVSSCTRCAFPFPRGVLHPFVAPSIPPRFPLSLCANIHPPTRLPSLHLPHLSPPHPTRPHITPSPFPSPVGPPPQCHPPLLSPVRSPLHPISIPTSPFPKASMSQLGTMRPRPTAHPIPVPQFPSAAAQQEQIPPPR